MKKNMEQYTVQLDPEFVKKLDKMANKYGLHRSQLMRNFLESAYEDAAVLDKMGIIPLVKGAKDAFRKFMEKMASKKEETEIEK